MMLNSVSRSLSDVGRKPSREGDLSCRPLYAPAITRMNAIGSSSSDLDETKPLLPGLEQLFHGGCARRLGLQPRTRFPLRQLDDLPVPDEIDQPERRHPGLPRAEEVA